MTSREPADAVIAAVATSIESDIQAVDGFDEWVETHGLGRTESPEAIVARQAAFHVCLVATLSASTASAGATEGDSETGHESVAGGGAVTGAVSGRESFEDYFLADASRLFDDSEVARLAGLQEQFVSAADPAEAIGRVHESLVPRTDRHKLGQFRTPPVIADLMAEWGVRSGDDVVLDPGIGAAALSMRAATVTQSRDAESRLDQLVGVDLSPLSVLMATVSLRLSDGEGEPTLHTRNFFDLQPADIGAVDTVIANPPYTRHHELDPAVKADLNDRMEAVAGRSISGLSPLYTYFYIHSTRFLADDGRLTFVTPSEFLETSYGEDLKAFLLDQYHVRGVVLYDREADSQFDEALTTSLVSFLERTPDDAADEPLTRFVRVDEWPGREAVLEAIDDGTAGDTEWGFVNTVRQADLDPADDWDGLLDPLEIGDDEGLVPFSDLGTVNRGIATGKNDFFCLSDADLTGSTGDYEWDIDERFLSPLVRNSRAVPHFDYRQADWEAQRADGDEVWLLYHLDRLDWDPDTHRTDTSGVPTATAGDRDDPADADRAQPSVVQYLKHGMDDRAVHDGYLASNRDPWYVFDRRDPPPILYTYMSRSRGRFVHNKTGGRTLTNLHCVYLDVDLTTGETKALLAYLNSPFADRIVTRSGRTYSTGMNKIEPNELEEVPVIDPRTLDAATVERLAALFDALCEASRHGDEDVVLERISDALDEILDI